MKITSFKPQVGKLLAETADYGQVPVNEITVEGGLLNVWATYPDGSSRRAVVMLKKGEFFLSDAPLECLVPPPGWACTREAGHEGPCAAFPLSWWQRLGRWWRRRK